MNNKRSLDSWKRFKQERQRQPTAKEQTNHNKNSKTGEAVWDSENKQTKQEHWVSLEEKWSSALKFWRTIISNLQFYT